MSKTITDRQGKYKEKVIENLKKIPVIQVACERTNIARATYYRWRNDDENFKEQSDEAISEGEAFINDMSESQLISLIKDKNLPAINLWLKTHHQKYTNKLRIEGNIQTEKALTPEQQQLVNQALKLASLTSESSEQRKEQNNE